MCKASTKSRLAKLNLGRVKSSFWKSPLFRTGKNNRGRYVTSPDADGGPPIVRYYSQQRLSEFRAAILAEMGEPPRTPMSDVYYRYMVVEGGWRRDESSERPEPRKRPGGKRQVPHAAIERINALRRRLLQMGDEEGAEECRKAIEELRGWGD